MDEKKLITLFTAVRCALIYILDAIEIALDIHPTNKEARKAYKAIAQKQ